MTKERSDELRGFVAPFPELVGPFFHTVFVYKGATKGRGA